MGPRQEGIAGRPSQKAINEASTREAPSNQFFEHRPPALSLEPTWTRRNPTGLRQGPADMLTNSG